MTALAMQLTITPDGVSAAQNSFVITAGYR